MRFLHRAVVACSGLLLLASAVSADVVRYVRFAQDGAASYGILDGERIHVLAGPPYAGAARTGAAVDLADVALLPPAEPSKVIAVGFNYISHLDEREKPAEPPIFLKLPTSIIGPEAEIVFPEGADNVHYEGELVIVIGKTASRISPERAGDYIFGVTAGNDVSARDWQASDLQWFRSKASDTFGPIGPVIATGLEYRDLLLTTRLNGEVRQQQRTSDHIHDAHAIVAYVSRYATLNPGDLIFTGTPGETSAMQPGDVVEIEIEGVGVLRNTIGTPIGR